MKHFIKFLGIGGIATFIQFVLLALFVRYRIMPELIIKTDNYPIAFFFNQPEFKLAPEVIASAASYFISSIFNYLANYHYTFASNSKHRETLPKFIVATSFGLATNTALFAIFFKFIHYYLFAQFLATGITVFLNFLIHKLWIYKGH